MLLSILQIFKKNLNRKVTKGEGQVKKLDAKDWKSK